MDVAESIASRFVTGKKPKHTINVTKVKATKKGWIVEGTATHSEERSVTSVNWIVEIEDGDVKSYEFEGGPGVAIM
jgi:hypothetical protein